MTFHLNRSRSRVVNRTSLNFSENIIECATKKIVTQFRRPFFCDQMNIPEFIELNFMTV